MAWDVIMPKMGMGMTVGKVVRWHCPDGATVRTGELICEVESDKITAELTAEVDGVLTILAQEDEETEVGAAIATIEPAEGAVLPERKAAADDDTQAIDAGGISLMVQASGEGEAVILLHGLASSMALWSALDMAALGGRRIIAYDLRGHGQSDKPAGAHTLNKHTADLIALMDALGVTRADLVGQSMGGLIALHTAARHGDRVGRVAVMNCGAVFDPEMQQRFFDLAAEAGFNGMGEPADVMTELSFSPGFAEANPDTLALIRQGIRNANPASFTAAARMVAKADLSLLLGDIACPVLVCAAEQDAMVPPARAQALCDGLPHGTLVTLPDCGHAAPLEQPTALMAHLARFLE